METNQRKMIWWESFCEKYTVSLAGLKKHELSHNLQKKKTILITSMPCMVKDLLS